jgi:hypothetical protein
MNKPITFKIGACFTGDLIFTLSGIKQVCEAKNVKAEIYLWLDRPVKAYDGAQHPNSGVGFTEHTYQMLLPLIESQAYVAALLPWRGEKIVVDLDTLRTQTIAPMPYGSITRWPGYAWPDMQCDLSQKWIDVDNLPWNGFDYVLRDNLNMKGKILINRTSRYQNSMIHYWFLKEYAKDLMFTGLPEEHEAFCKQWEIDIPLLQVKDFLELAIALRSCRYFIGNQSMCFALAEAMKIPRVLEVCPYAPNVIPCGRDGYDFLHQFAVEWMVKDAESPLNKL